MLLFSVSVFHIFTFEKEPPRLQYILKCKLQCGTPKGPFSIPKVTFRVLKLRHGVLEMLLSCMFGRDVVFVLFSFM
jgi:hypothetical protein